MIVESNDPRGRSDESGSPLSDSRQCTSSATTLPGGDDDVGGVIKRQVRFVLLQRFFQIVLFSWHALSAAYRYVVNFMRAFASVPTTRLFKGS